MKVKDLTEQDLHKSVTEIIRRMHITVLTPSYRYRSFTKVKNGNKLEGKEYTNGNLNREI